MRRVSRTLCLAVAICATLVTAALAVAPPAGTPDLGRMTIQASDLAPGAQIVKDGYTSPPAGVVAGYSRDWRPATTAGGVRLAVASTAILLLPSAANAGTVLAGEKRIFKTKADRPLVARLIALNAGHSGVKAKDIGFGRLRTIAIGNAAFVLPLTLHFRGSHVAIDLFVVNVNDVVAEVVVLAGGRSAAAKGGRELTADVAAHVTAVLAATGATGPSGPTG